MRGLIVTIDDFGAASAVNEAVERGHREGIVTAASLMVSGSACADAVQRAQRLPRLGVGLHVVLADGRPVLPAGHIPHLVGPDGRFHSDMVRTAFAIALSPSARAQMRAEVAAQFAAFAATGLRLDHVNAHKHFHLHPMIASAILEIGPRYGMRAMRVPHERETPPALRWWSRRLAKRLRRAGILVNDEVVGLRWSGAFDAGRMRQALGALPDGLTELYCHAASADSYPGSAAGYRYRDEFAALLDPGVHAALAASGTRHGCFGDFTIATTG
ncbi:MAG: hopanoid biosynthesis-associated protein HpnK [Novosphingobium sp.]|jgi:hopanoid biosynthesis associated protein HpnK|nr:hopanoid biosynthesis-associated protein HpnK [Novosphingobium sp.]